MAIERIERDEGDERAVAWSDELSADEEPHRGMSAVPSRRAAVAALERAAYVVDSEPDLAIGLLDEALSRMIELWFARHGHELWLEVGELDGIEDVIEWADPGVGLQLRLALHAADLRVRLRHCRAMLVLVERADVGLERGDAGCAASRFEAQRASHAGHQQPAVDDDESK